MKSGRSATQVERAKRLLASEGDSGNNADECASAAWRVYEKLNVRLVPLLGSAGVDALFVRSARLEQAEFASLAEVAAPDGMKRLGACLRTLEPDAATEAAASLFGAFLDLITTFIGERLTAVVLRSAWPEVAEAAPRETKK